MTKETRSQERGKARIQELREMFSEMPQHLVLKIDAIKEGLRHTPVLDEVGKWAIPDAHELFEYDYEEHSAKDVAAGYTLTPHSFHLKNGAPVKCMFNSTSPYEIKYEGRGCFWLYRDDDPLEQVTFPPCPQWYRKTTSSGKPMSSVLSLRGDRCLELITTNYCEYFKDGNQCQYCNITPTAEHLAELGQDRAMTKREQDLYETYLACAQETGVERISLTGGGFYDRSKEADLYIRIYSVLQKAMKDSGCHLSLIYGGQAQDEVNLIRLKEAGASTVGCNLEVWDPKMFEVICPGKAKSVGREHWIECLLKAVEIFGWGRVASVFVVGVEMASPFGFKTEDEAAASVTEGYRFMAAHGIRPDHILWRNVPGSRLAQGLRPSTEYFLRMECERHNILKEHNMASWRGGAGQWPPIEFCHSFNHEWLDMPEEAIWPPALRG